MHQPGPTADVIPFLLKRAERARARYLGLYSSERTETATQDYIFAVLDYAVGHCRTGDPEKRRWKVTDTFAEIASRAEEICGPPVPLPPELDALVHRLAQPEVWRELRDVLDASSTTKPRLS